MVYGAPPFHKLGIYQKMRAIPDPKYCIEYPENATRFESLQGSGDRPPQQNEILGHMARKVPAVVIKTGDDTGVTRERVVGDERQ